MFSKSAWFQSYTESSGCVNIEDFQAFSGDWDRLQVNKTTDLRHNCVLNKDLFRCNIINSSLCTCDKIEDAYHFFFSL
jgi:hypothetical protein